MPLLPIKKTTFIMPRFYFSLLNSPPTKCQSYPMLSVQLLVSGTQDIKSPSNWLPLHAVMLRKINLHQSRKGRTKYVYHCYCKCCICRHLYDRRLVGVWEAKCCLVIQLWPPNCSEKNQSYSSFVTYRMFVKQLCLPGLFEAHRKFLLEQLVSEWHHWFRFAGICPTHRHQNLLSWQWSKANFDF